jgi:hypothetical protein
MGISGKLVLVGLALVAAGVPAVVVASHGSTPPPDLSRPIPRGEAESLLRHTVALAQAGDIDAICASIAADKRLCDFQRQTNHTPGRIAPTVAGYHPALGQSPTMVLKLKGTYDDGTKYTSDFSVTRTAPDRLVSLTPVYWSGVRFDPGAAPKAAAEF